ncbi:DUF309 domain-containing protein [Neobacillus pocheonensis]|uniref:DUF309 domain-containing protein n=1 Tax=Neobacillus pocheonensis TaxID=363869 RepID=UPI003D297776
MYPNEYIQFLAHFHGDRDYFECHEILEDYWKKTDPSNKDSIWVGLIQVAVSAYHHRRGNYNGAKRTLEKAIRILRIQEAEVISLGLDHLPFQILLNDRLSLIEKGEVYQSFNLPICDPFLLKLGKSFCEHHGYEWGQKSDLTNRSLVDRHTLRDRTEVIEERIQSLKMRKGSE